MSMLPFKIGVKEGGDTKKAVRNITDILNVDLDSTNHTSFFIT